MPSNAQSVTARRAKAISLIQSGLVHSQSDLVVLLKKAGYKVTQATASRDLEEIGAVRARNKNGESTYQIRESAEDAIARSTPLPSQLILSVDHSANLAVIHTPPGAAQFFSQFTRPCWLNWCNWHYCWRRHDYLGVQESDRWSPFSERIACLRTIRWKEEVMALWGGRFTQGPEESVFALSRSVHFDWRLAPYDLRSSKAHLAVLKKSGLIAATDADAISAALNELSAEVVLGSFVAIDSDEDVHSALERGLTEKIGALGGVIRAGRSRNDQVTTDLRLFSIDHMLEVGRLITLLQTAILEKASEYVNDPAPGFTHIQHAQPVSFGHELAKHAHAFARDLDRINDWLARTSVSFIGCWRTCWFLSCIRTSIYRAESWVQFIFC
jgi:arginine repressor